MVVLLVVGCGGSNRPGAKLIRLGCHQFCQQAGGYGGAPGGLKVLRIEVPNTITPLADGTVPIAVACAIPVPCATASRLGRINIWTVSAAGQDQSFIGGSDLILAGHSSATFAVSLLPAGTQLLRSRGRIEIDIHADAGVSDRARRSRR
jgi:hypothetical protein